MLVEELENNIDNFLSDLRDDEIAQTSLQVYRTNISQFIEYLKGHNKSTLNKSIYQDYRDYMKTDKGYKISTVNKYIVVLNKYFAYLGREDLKIKQLRYQRKHYLENVPTVTDYKRVLRSAKKNDLDAYWIIQIISYTSSRVSVVREITIEILKDAKHNDDYIKIYSKGKYNEIPFPAWLRRELLKYAKEKGITSGYLFPSPRIKGKPLTRKAIWEKIQRVTGLARVNLNKGHPHAFRHLFGKEITSVLGGDNQTIADIFGHESTKTSEIYQQKSKKEISEIINKFRYK